MSGENLRKLEQWVAGMEPEDVDSSGVAWRSSATSLGNVRKALREAARQVRDGFGDNPEGVGATAFDAFTATAERIEEQELRMERASEALIAVRRAMTAARTTKEGAPPAPGPAPRPSDYPDYALDPLAMIRHAADTVVHAAAVDAHNRADGEARQRIEELTDKYGEAVEVMAEIHGDPYIPMDPDGTADAGAPGGPGTGRGPVRPPTPILPEGPDGWPPVTLEWAPDDVDEDDPILPPRNDEEDPPVGGPLPADPLLPGPVVDPSGPVHPTPGATGPGAGTGGLPPGLVGGGLAAAGVLGTPGVVNGIRNLLARGAPSANAGAIGSTTRTGGPGALGRTGGAVPGSPVSRSAGAGTGGRGAAGGRGPGGSPGGAGGRGTGVPGAATGRGGAGARGTTVGGAGGARGRGRSDDEATREADLFDDGQDWIDDEGTAPGVLG